MASMIRSITGKWPTPAEKCWALFYWNHIARRQTSPMHLHGLDLTDPIRQFNDYGFTMCSTIAGINCSIWDAMGLKTKYWDISLHTVPEVFYDGRYHMVDNSMSAIYTLCDGKTIAGVEDIGKEGACAASGGRVEPGHVARYHCLNATSARGFLTGADCERSLESEYGCFNPKGLKYRYYFYDWDRGHRYILNLRDGEAYTRHYKSLGTSLEFYVPNNGKDPESVNPRYRIRGNGVRTWKPTLPPNGVGAGETVFKVEGANVITSLAVKAAFERRAADDLAALAVSTTNGLAWQEVWKADKTGEVPLDTKLVEPVNGAYEVLVKATLKGSAALKSIEFQALTELNSKTQPKLLLGKNTVYVGLGEQTEAIVVWPDLQGEAYKPYAVEERNIATKEKHPGYMGVLYAAKANEDAYVTFRIDAPTDITRVTYGGRLYNRAPKSHIDFLHSFDGGKTWTKSYSLTDTKPPWDVIRYETVESVPAATRSVLFKCLWNSSAAGTDACSIYAVRMEANHKPLGPPSLPMAVTFDWSEVQKDRSPVERSHTQVVEKVPCRYTINVGGYDQPIVNSLRIANLPQAPRPAGGYSDGKDVGGEKFVYRWVSYGKNLAEGKPYTSSVPSETNWGAGDPDGKKLTDGIVGPPYAGGGTPRFGAAWKQGQHPAVTVDLGKSEACGAFRIQIGAGWPWWDALKGQVQDKVEVLTSLDGNAYASQGFFDFDLRWKDIPINHLMPDDETAQGYCFALIPAKPVQARYVRFAITPERILTVSEVQVLDFIRFEPFDLRIALPDDKVAEAPAPAPDPPGPQAAPKAELPRLKVNTVGEPPKIDGVLDDQAWSQASGSADFKLPFGETPSATTRLYVGQDKDCLYVAVECFDTAEGIEKLAAKTAQHDGPALYEDDDVELFLDPTGERQSYYQIMINPRGVTWDACHATTRNPDLRWEPRFRSAVHIGKTCWTAEFAFPWAVFDRSPKCSADWAFNVLRGRATAGESVYWSPVFDRSAHTPEKFGTLTGIAGKLPAYTPPPKKAPPAPVLKMLFDFEDPADLGGWSSPVIPGAKAKEPPVRIELAADNATSGKQSLKLTFDGGAWPAVATAAIPVKGNWSEFKTFKADVAASRPCLVGFRVLQEKSSRADSWEGNVSRWEKTELLKPGLNAIVGDLHPQEWSALKPDLGNVASFEIYLYAPHKGEAIYVDNIRLTSANEVPKPPEVRFTVPGTKLEVWGVNKLAPLVEQLKAQWQPPQGERTVEQVEAAFKARYEELKKTHPKAAMAVLRAGEGGFAGWADTHIDSHGPDGNLGGRGSNKGRYETLEVFMRHRSWLMRVDLASIPKGSSILAAELLLVRADGEPPTKPNLWVAEPCNRPWTEYEANAYEYAKDKFWKAVGGMYYGDDPDFLPIFLALGPAQGAVNTWDFTNAVRFWTDGSHENHGFFFHGAGYYWRAFSREAREVKKRPALLVVYEPKAATP